jgi:putative transposase
MDGNVWRTAHLKLEQMEERRLAAAALLHLGQLSQAEIARQLAVSRASVCRWAATLAQQGPRGLEARPIPGRSPRLDEKAWARLGRLLDRGAVAAGFATERWTLGRIAAVIEREFGVSYHPRYSERPLKAHGFSVQRRATRAKERDELVIAVWPRRDWVALKKAQREHRTLLLVDATGHSFRARQATTWARRALTPVLRRVSKRREVSSMVAITLDVRLYARHFRTSISSRSVIPALRFFRRSPICTAWPAANSVARKGKPK